MNVLLIHRYFWPDTPPYAYMLKEIGQHLVDHGHEVDVFSTQPDYKGHFSVNRQPTSEVINRLNIKRLTMFKENGRSVIFRLINMFYFSLRVFVYIALSGRHNAVMVSTAPPILLAFFAALAAKLTNKKFIYHCMDIHPEIGRISGEFSNVFLFKLLLSLDSLTCKWASRIVVLSGDMQNSILQRPGLEGLKNIDLIANFDISNEVSHVEAPKEFKKIDTKFRILFAGNIGRFQNLTSLLNVLHYLSDNPEIEFVFIGEGAEKNALIEKYADKLNKQLFFFPHQSVDIARAIIKDADLGLVSLSKDIYKYAYPSKTMTYLAESCPILSFVESSSELSKFVLNEHIGIVASPDNLQELAIQIRELFNSNSKQEEMKLNAKQASKSYFSKSLIMEKWVNLYLSLDR
jgi:colanic acid biosynthesis glycosyl transferase WcaI